MWDPFRFKTFDCVACLVTVWHTEHISRFDFRRDITCVGGKSRFFKRFSMWRKRLKAVACLLLLNLEFNGLSSCRRYIVLWSQGHFTTLFLSLMILSRYVLSFIYPMNDHCPVLFNLCMYFPWIFSSLLLGSYRSHCNWLVFGPCLTPAPSNPDHTLYISLQVTINVGNWISNCWTFHTKTYMEYNLKGKITKKGSD